MGGKIKHIIWGVSLVLLWCAVVDATDCANVFPTPVNVVSDSGTVKINGTVTNTGRIDLTVKTDNAIYILEFKVDGGEGRALQQIKEKGYQEKYMNDGRTIYLVGIDFDAEHRKVANFEWEQV